MLTIVPSVPLPGKDSLVLLQAIAGLNGLVMILSRYPEQWCLCGLKTLFQS